MSCGHILPWSRKDIVWGGKGVYFCEGPCQSYDVEERTIELLLVILKEVSAIVFWSPERQTAEISLG